MAEPKSGDQLGPFRLVSYLNRGGNAWVWSARGSDGGEVALKILMNRNPDSEPWKRFEREAKLQRDLTAEGFAGILPLLDFHIPQRGEPTRAWLALPVAVSARDAFGAKPNLDDVVASLSTIARTLAQLHVRPHPGVDYTLVGLQHTASPTYHMRLSTGRLIDREADLLKRASRPPLGRPVMSG